MKFEIDIFHKDVKYGVPVCKILGQRVSAKTLLHRLTKANDGLSVQELAQLSGKSPFTIYKYIDGTLKVPVEVLNAVAIKLRQK